MPDTYVKGSIAGKWETREFDFRVVKRSAQVGLPQTAIDALGLSQVPGFPLIRRLTTAQTARRPTSPA